MLIRNNRSARKTKTYIPEELKDEIIKFREENSVFTKTERLLEKEGLLDKK